jgi:hypothetical protein
MRPDVGSITAPRHFNSVLLPEPLGPINPDLAGLDDHVHAFQRIDCGIALAVALAGRLISIAG